MRGASFSKVKALPANLLTYLVPPGQSQLHIEKSGHSFDGCGVPSQ